MTAGGRTAMEGRMDVDGAMGRVARVLMETHEETVARAEAAEAQRDAALADAARLRVAGAEALAAVEEAEAVMQREWSRLMDEGSAAQQAGRLDAAMAFARERHAIGWAMEQARRPLARLDALAAAVTGHAAGPVHGEGME